MKRRELSQLWTTMRAAGQAWTVWGIAAVVASVASLAMLLALFIGDVADIPSLDEDEWLAGVVWVLYGVGSVVALITGVVALVGSRRESPRGDTRPGAIGVGWFVFAVAARIIARALE